MRRHAVRSQVGEEQYMELPSDVTPQSILGAKPKAYSLVNHSGGGALAAVALISWKNPDNFGECNPFRVQS